MGCAAACDRDASRQTSSCSPLLVLPSCARTCHKVRRDSLCHRGEATGHADRRACTLLSHVITTLHRLHAWGAAAAPESTTCSTAACLQFQSSKHITRTLQSSTDQLYDDHRRSQLSGAASCVPAPASQRRTHPPACPVARAPPPGRPRHRPPACPQPAPQPCASPRSRACRGGRLRGL